MIDRRSLLLGAAAVGAATSLPPVAVAQAPMVARNLRFSPISGMAFDLYINGKKIDFPPSPMYAGRKYVVRTELVDGKMRGRLVDIGPDNG